MRNPHSKVDLARIEVSRVIDASRTAVWSTLSDLDSHVNWMRDARSIVFTTEQTRGVGTRMEVETRLGPFRTRDVLAVTGWEEGRSITVAHLGAIEGDGSISIHDEMGRCKVVWAERLRFPWWLGGALGTWLARPLLAAVVRGNLVRLDSLVNAP